MSLREQLLKEIEQTPDALLGELIDYVQGLRIQSAEAPNSVRERLAAYQIWSGHLTSPIEISEHAFERDSLEREIN